MRAMDGAATLGGFTSLPQATRIWLDDPNPIFRRGLAASLRDSRFVVVGESAGFVPPPALDGVDVLVFDLGEQSADWALLSRSLLGRHRRNTRLVGLVPGGDADAIGRSQCTVLARAELTPEGFRHCIASVVAGASAPAAVSRSDGAGRPGSVRAARVGAGARLRRLMARKGALFAVVVALGAGVFGPSGKADGLGPDPGSSGSLEMASAAGPMTVSPAAETVPVQSAKDAAGDIAVWVNPTAPAASLVIGTDRQGAALESYDLKGNRVQRLARPAGSVNDVDIRTGFSLGGGTVTLVGAGGRGMSFYRLDPAGRRLSDVGARRFVDVGAEAFCLYRSAVSGRFYGFAVSSRGDVTQYELFDQGGFVDAREVRRWPLGERAGGCVADDESGRLFLSEARSGIWRYNAEPDASPVERRQIDRTGGGGHLAGDVEGLAIVTQPGRRGFVVASSQGDSTFAIYRRGGDHAWLGQREVADGTAADGCTDTDGIEAVAANLGPDFPAGIFICQDGRNTTPGPAGNQNFKYVRLERIVDAASLPT